MALNGIVSDIDRVNKKFRILGLSSQRFISKPPRNRDCCSGTRKYHSYVASAVLATAALLYNTNIVSDIWSYALGVRCILPNNYIVWEATRPISDCTYCETDVTVLHNVTLQSFTPHAYASRPILLKGAALEWPAITRFTPTYFRELYAPYTDDDVCQFLHFKSKFDTLADVLRVQQTTDGWYVGWANCHPEILAAMRRFYPGRPPFLPRASELPSRDYVFMGYGVGAESEGAAMHIDFIGRLMWQAQLRGSKRWRLLPINECEGRCRGAEGGVEFTAQPGDVVLVDTRLWYHATRIDPPGQFSISIQSEYG